MQYEKKIRASDTFVNISALSLNFPTGVLFGERSLLSKRGLDDPPELFAIERAEHSRA